MLLRGVLLTTLCFVTVTGLQDWSSYISNTVSSLVSFGTSDGNAAMSDVNKGGEGKRFKATLYFNGECCDGGHVVQFKEGSNLLDVRQRAARLFAKELGDDAVPTTIKLYDDIGLVTNMERIVGDLGLELNQFVPPLSFWVVPSGALFVWPTVKIGHVQRPQGVTSANASKPIELETLSLSPRVFFVRNFLSDEEIEKLISFAKDKLKRSHVGIGNEVFSDDRTSKTAWDTSSPNSLAIQHRAFDLVRIPFAVNQADAVQIIRYFEGQTYVGHTDYFDSGYENIDPSKEEGTNRFMTIFAYLSDVEEGGHTVFPKSRTHPRHMTASVLSKELRKEKNQKKQKKQKKQKRTRSEKDSTNVMSVDADGTTETEREEEEGEGEQEHDEEKDHCVGWIQTKDCDPNGEIDEEKSLKCNERVANGNSGYCDCGNGQQVMRVTCEHSAFLCNNACAGRVSDGTTQSGSTFDHFVRECDAGEGLVVAPKRGDALLFYSQSPTGHLDPNSYHGGCPVLRGEKWASNVWVWNRKRPVFDGGTKKLVDSNNLKMVFLNTKTFVVEVYWQSYDGPLKYFDLIHPGQSYSVDTYTGHVWVIKKKGVDEEVARHTAAKGISSAVSV